ncbi:hypothetical protein ACFP81_06765 [Deinococcus lacus]|uniref:Two-component sensor histidine kinase n=1 Tax=Deinococcus lacus TaxID=392561 RepID=A0ABW1YBY2_9DEIO
MKPASSLLAGWHAALGSLRVRLTLWAALATALAAGLVAGGLYLAVGHFLIVSQQERLLGQAVAAQSRTERALDLAGALTRPTGRTWPL